MPDLKDLLSSKLFDIVDRVGISTPKQIIVLSVWDIKKLTNLNNDDIMLLKNIVANLLCPLSVTADKLVGDVNNHLKITTGCDAIDNILKGGLRTGTLTEIYGESGSGKTQLGIQAITCNWSNGCFYICTEDLFPVKRFEQIKQNIPNFNPNIDYGKNIFVEHITEPHDLLSCVRVRLPKLLDTVKLSLIVIDSVAAPFRFENTNYVQRAEELRELAIALLDVAQKNNLAVLCINQVRTSLDETDGVLPSLGLAWSNMVSTRLCLKKTVKISDIQSLPQSNHEQQKSYVRELSVVFAPNLSNSKVELVITSNGIQSV